MAPMKETHYWNHNSTSVNAGAWRIRWIVCLPNLRQDSNYTQAAHVCLNWRLDTSTSTLAPLLKHIIRNPVTFPHNSPTLRAFTYACLVFLTHHIKFLRGVYTHRRVSATPSIQHSKAYARTHARNPTRVQKSAAAASLYGYDVAYARYLLNGVRESTTTRVARLNARGVSLSVTKKNEATLQRFTHANSGVGALLGWQRDVSER